MKFPPAQSRQQHLLLMNDTTKYSDEVRLRLVLQATLACPENPLLWYFQILMVFIFWGKMEKKTLVVRSRLLGFGPGGYPSHACFSSHAN